MDDDKPTFPEGVWPRIWSESRQAICSTFPWFAQYQGGVHTSNGVAVGYLLGSFGAERDTWQNDGTHIISHGGGGNPTTTRGATSQRAEDKSVVGLYEAHKLGRPIVLIADRGYPLFPWAFPAKMNYVVLGYYHITNVWFEPSGGVDRFKVLFQRAEPQTHPWWIDGPEVLNDPMLVAPQKRQCTHCTKSSPRIYEISWLCLHPECPQYWRLPNGSRAPDDLIYHDAFFARILMPPLRDEDEIYNYDTRRTHTRGHRCDQRNCVFSRCLFLDQAMEYNVLLSTRIYWNRWQCLHCGAEVPDEPLKLMGPQEGINMPSWTAEHDYIIHNASVKLEQQTIDRANVVIDTFTLPLDGDGLAEVHVINDTRHSCPDVDALFEAFQDEAISGDFVQRTRLRKIHLSSYKGTFFVNYFSHNAGVHYDYVAQHEKTMHMDDAPKPVQGALDVIKAHCKNVLLPNDYRFNEVMTTGYLEPAEMKASLFHNDGDQVGRAIAIMSFGSPAIMTFARKTETDGKVQQQEVLKVVLKHGTTLVMMGKVLQQEYEHMVESKGLRFAVSARIIEKSSRGPPVRSRQPEPTNSAASSATPVAAAMSPRRTDPVQPVAGPSRLRQASSSPAEQRQNRRLATNGPHPGLRTTVWVGGLPRGEGAFDARVDLNNIFSSAGNIVSIDMKQGKKRSSHSHAFIQFEDYSSARRATQLSLEPYYGKTLQVKWAKPSGHLQR